MGEPKTIVNDLNVKDFIRSVEDEGKREDSLKIIDIMQEITGCEPKMWGKSIIGFGTYSYVYASGRKGDWPISAFSPRKSNLTLYIMEGFSRKDELLADLGPHKLGKSCLYIRRLSLVNESVLKELVSESVKWMRSNYETSD